MSYSQNAVSGFSWHTLFKIATAAITLLKVSFLARLLSPDMFGLFSLATIALGVTEAATETGVNVTIIRSKHSVDYFVDTAWVIAIVRGFAIGSVMLVLGVLLSNFFNQPELVSLIGIASLIPVIKGFINPSIVGLQKEFSFFRDTAYRTSLAVVDAGATILIALVWPSVYALMLGMIVSAVFEVGISFWFFTLRPRFHYLSSRAAVILGNAKWLSLSAILSYINENADNFLIGKLVGTYQLGLYHTAYSLSHKTNLEFAKAALHSTFPIFSKLKDQPDRLRRGLYKSLAGWGAVAFGASLPLLVAPEFVVRVLLGDQWLGVVPHLKWLVLAGLLQGCTVLLYSLLLARGYLKLVNLHQAVSAAFLVLFVLILGSYYGLLGAVIAVFLSRLLSSPLLILGVRSSLYEKSQN